MRSPDIFSDQFLTLDTQINPYLPQLIERIGDNIWAGSMLKGHRGNWRQTILGHGAANNPLIVEIGCHKGDTLLSMAVDFPQWSFLGLDITFKRVVTTAERAKQQGLKNVHVILANASALEQLFAPGEIDTFVVFFPDPWTKKKQQKNRLLNETFLKKMRGCLQPQGSFWFKTDEKGYFDSVSELLPINQFSLSEPSSEQPTDQLALQGYSSCFEQRFLHQKLPIYSGLWRPLPS